MLVLSPRAVERLEPAARPAPAAQDLRLVKNGKLIEAFSKARRSTPHRCLRSKTGSCARLGRRVGGLPGLIARADANAAALDRWVQRAEWIEHRPAPGDPLQHIGVLAVRRPLDVEADAAGRKRSSNCSSAEQAAFDIGSYRDAPARPAHLGGARSTPRTLSLGPCLDWAFEQAISGEQTR